MAEAPAPPPAPELPTALAQRFVRYVAGFGVGVAIGLAPFLGKLRIPGFDALLSLFPLDLQRTVLPLAAFLMGVVAVVVQFYAGERTSRKALRRRFKWALAGLAAGFLALLVLYFLVVVRVPVDGGDDAVAVVLAFTPRLPTCGCPPSDDDVECLRSLSLQSAAVASCWGRRPIALASLALTLAYLTATVSFGALIGLLLIREDHPRAPAPAP